MIDALSDMALFVEVARTKSFSKAAKVLDMPKSSLSRRISGLERTVRLRLFNRTTRTVELTEAGAIYFSRCEAIVEAAQIAHEQISNIAELPRGTLRISMTPDFATAFMAPLMVQFAAMYPEIDFDLDLSPRHVDMLVENFDLAIRLGVQPNSGLISRHLCNVRTGLYATPQFLSQFGEPNEPNDLSRFACIINPDGRTRSPWRLSNGVEEHLVPVSGRFRANNPGVKRRLAMLDAGIIILDETVALEDVAKGRLKRVLPSWDLEPMPVTALVPSRLMPAKTRVFLDYISEQLRGLT